MVASVVLVLMGEEGMGMERSRGAVVLLLVGDGWVRWLARGDGY